MLKVAVGHSEDVDAKDAVLEVLEQCQETLNGLVPQAGILYSAMAFDYPVVLEHIMTVYPELELIGCTTDGEISSKLGCIEDSITLIFFILIRFKLKQV